MTTAGLTRAVIHIARGTVIVRANILVARWRWIEHNIAICVHFALNTNTLRVAAPWRRIIRSTNVCVAIVWARATTQTIIGFVSWAWTITRA